MQRRNVELKLCISQATPNKSSWMLFFCISIGYLLHLAHLHIVYWHQAELQWPPSFAWYRYCFESAPYAEGDGESGFDSDGDDERVTGHLFLPHTYRDHFFSGGQRKLCSEYIIEGKVQNTKINENVTRIFNRTTTQWICWILKKNITQQSWIRRRIWWQKCFKLPSKASEISRKRYSYHVVQILDQF